MSVSSALKGLLVVSLDSGILLFSEPLENNYGISKNKIDAMQLSSTIFALFKLSSEISSGDRDNSWDHKLRWIRKEDTVILFDEHHNTEEESSFLTVLCTHQGIDMILLQSLGEEISEAFGASNISTLHSPRASTLKDFRDTFVAIMKNYDASKGKLLLSPQPEIHIRKRMADYWMDKESSDDNYCTHGALPSGITVAAIIQHFEAERITLSDVHANESQQFRIEDSGNSNNEGLIIHAASDIEFEDQSSRGIFTCCFHGSKVQSLPS